MVLKARAQHQHPMGPCQKRKFSGSTLDLEILNPARWFRRTLKFENRGSRSRTSMLGARPWNQQLQSRISGRTLVLPNQKLCFNKIPGRFACALKFEKRWAGLRHRAPQRTFFLDVTWSGIINWQAASRCSYCSFWPAQCFESSNRNLDSLLFLEN